MGLVVVNKWLLKATVEFLWWVGGVCIVIFMSKPTTALRLCCVVVGVVTTKTRWSQVWQLRIRTNILVDVKRFCSAGLYPYSIKYHPAVRLG